MSFLERLNEIAEKTENHLSGLLSAKGRSKNLSRAIEYSALGGGKRLRAYMVAEFSYLCGRNDDGFLDYAAAIEMVHAFSLIHDDLPAMDNDDMRRGKPSNHKAFGEATAILAGDSLALDAFGVICESSYCSPHQNEKAVIALSRYSGSAGMCAGQQFDLDGEGKRISIEELTTLVDLKTGALFSCACMLGCISASATPEMIDAAEKFGLYTGRAFQITDDLLDIHSTPEELGKTIGKDIESQKSTFPALLGEGEARRYAEECIAEARNCLECFDDGEAKNRLTEFCEYILIRRK
ncbi:MAG: polyprenyl synthetase family protein [Ruminococcaceae bacterium]|nr:polyprenyl synthetase family protein [Oscillospiraceae bacterium]